MTNITKRDHVISVFPSEQQPGSYRWSITALSTTSVTQSPYAFATALGATMSPRSVGARDRGKGQRMTLSSLIIEEQMHRDPA